MLNKLKVRITLQQLRFLDRWAQECIDSGDPDLDDTLYRTRNATRDLLEIWDKED